MKLATVNSQVDLNNLPNLLPKDVRTRIHDRSLHVTTFGVRYGSRGPSSHFVPVCDQVHQSCGPPHFSLETSGAPLSYLSQPHHGSPLGCMDNQSCMHPLDTAFCLAINPQYHFLNGVSDASSQVKNATIVLWLLTSLDHIHAVTLTVNIDTSHRLGISSLAFPRAGE